MPKNIFVFDLGKVLLDFDYAIAAENIAARTGVTREKIQEFVGATPLLLSYEEGKHTTAEFFEQVKKATGFPGDLNEFGRLFGNIFTPIEPMIAFQAACREAGHATWIFSNTNELAVEFIRPRFPFFSRFTGWILSYECRSMKPEAGMYEQLERITGAAASNFVYVDDRPENIETAVRRGWNAVVHVDPRKSIEQLSPYLGR